jgi:hypothetical protein
MHLFFIKFETWFATKIENYRSYLRLNLWLLSKVLFLAENKFHKGGKMRNYYLKVMAILIAAISLTASSVFAEEPITLSHTVTGYAESINEDGFDMATIEVLLHIENTEAEQISNLMLLHVPQVLIFGDELILNIGNLEAFGTLDVPISISTPASFSEEEISGFPLFWAVEATDSSNNYIDFPSESLSSGGGI